MNDPETSPAPTADRAVWIRRLRRVNEAQEDALASVFDANWAEIEDTHRIFLERFLSLLAPGGKVLDAACATGKYFPLVLAGGHSLLGVDHAGAYLAEAEAKFPEVTTEKHDLQDLPYENNFDGVICVDAMEFIPPEDWPTVLERFRRALHPAGRVYLTVELASEQRVRALTEEARRSGHPTRRRRRGRHSSWRASFRSSRGRSRSGSADPRSSRMPSAGPALWSRLRDLPY